MKKDHTIFLIGRIQYKAERFLIREMKAHHMKGLATSHAEIIGSLIIHGPLHMTEIARIIDKDKSTITALIQKLIKMGYVEKKKYEADNRINLISLTEKGAALKPEFLIISKKLRSISYAGVSDEEREQLISLLTKINNNL